MIFEHPRVLRNEFQNRNMFSMFPDFWEDFHFFQNEISGQPIQELRRRAKRSSSLKIYNASVKKPLQIYELQ